MKVIYEQYGHCKIFSKTKLHKDDFEKIYSAIYNYLKCEFGEVHSETLELQNIKSIEFDISYKYYYWDYDERFIYEGINVEEIKRNAG